MTPELLWKAFFEAHIPANQLKALGHDLYFARSTPSDEAAPAVSGITKHLGLAHVEAPRFVYAAMNTDPGRKALEQLAEDYRTDKSWDKAADSTKSYMKRVADRITIIAKTLADRSDNKGQNPIVAAGSRLSLFWPFILSAAMIGGGYAYARHREGRQNDKQRSHQQRDVMFVA